MPPAEPSKAQGSSRPLPRWLLILAAALLVARIGTGIYEHQHPPAPAADDASGHAQGPPVADLVAWVPAERAEAESQRTGKPILYEFSAAWCGPCKMMAREVFADPQAASVIGSMFVPVHVVDRKMEEGHNSEQVDRLMSAYSIDGFPTLIVTWPGKGKYESTSGYGGRTGTVQWLAAASVKVRRDAPGASADSTIHR